MVAACTNGDETNPGTSEAPPPEATTTTSEAPGTTTTTATPGAATEARTEFGILITYEHSIAVRQADGETTVLEGDFETPLIAAYDDLNGGIVYQYAQTPANLGNAILHVTPGNQPAELVRADIGQTIRLLDVGFYNERIQVLYSTGSDLLVAGISGGAPELVATLDGVVAASLSQGEIAVSQFDGACNTAQILSVEDKVIHDCAPDPIDLRINGDEHVNLLDGMIESSVQANWNADLRSTTEIFDFEGDIVAARDGATGFKLLDTNGASFSFRASQPVQFVSILRAETDLGEGLFLGGMGTPSDFCSALGLPSPPLNQDSLPDAVGETRAAIVEAATECDFAALERLAGPDFLYSLDPSSASDLSRFWQQSDQQNFDTLAVIVRTFDLPFAMITSAEGAVSYVWPAVTEIQNPTEEDWQTLAAVYNEEEIEFYKEFGGFIGWRIYISADGTWTTAIAGD